MARIIERIISVMQEWPAAVIGRIADDKYSCIHCGVNLAEVIGIDLVASRSPEGIAEITTRIGPVQGDTTRSIEPQIRCTAKIKDRVGDIETIRPVILQRTVINKNTGARSSDAVVAMGYGAIDDLAGTDWSSGGISEYTVIL